jgi:TonB family protein
MKQFLIICFSLGFFSSSAQDKNSFYALDKNMNQTVLDSSKYILWIHEKDSAQWQWDYYYTWGPMVKSTTYADHDGTVLNGRFCIYNTMGNLDSTGFYDHGKKNGSIFKLRSYSKDSIVTIKQYDYVQDSLVKTIDLLTERIKNKSSDTTKETESEYPGGISKWTYYLIHNLVYPERAMNKDIQGQVLVFFMVDQEGNVVEPYIQKSVEYSLDQASLELIKKSGKWVPGMKDGLPFKAHKVQPVNYKLESQ